jgi:hypothetical protein
MCRHFIRFLLAAQFLIFSPGVAANDDKTPAVDEKPLALIAHAGKASLKGDLTGNAEGTSSGLSLLIYAPHRDDWLAFLMIFDFTSTRATAAKEPKFPFAANSSLRISETGLVPMLCMMADSPVQACLGAGYNLVRVSNSHSEQTFGTYRGDLLLGHYFGSGIIGGLEAHAYGVEQRLYDVESSFTVIAYQAGIGYRW